MIGAAYFSRHAGPRRPRAARRCKEALSSTATGPNPRQGCRSVESAAPKWRLLRILVEGVPMPSPLSGMDPYLEAETLWPAFQRQLVHALYQMLLPGLMDRYRARVSERIYTSEQALFTSVLREEHHESLLELRQRSDGRLVTLIEVVSP